MSKIILFSFVMVLFASCAQQAETEVTKKICGLSFVSVNKDISKVDIQPMKEVGADWVSVIPFAFISAKDNPNLAFNSKWQWKGERLDGAQAYIQEMHAEGLSVMLKPQIWVGRGVFTGFIEMSSDDDWEVFENKYQDYILEFAKMAEAEKVEMICLGTELNRFAIARADFWSSMIDKVRGVYSGKLTYAENWDCFDRISFWSKLDYIGVDAYFPIANGNKPTAETLVKGWKVHVAKMDSIFKLLNKQILFTEYGYRSTINCAEKPWDYSETAEINQESQVNALRSLYDVMWQKESFAGGFLWKWFPDHKNAGGESNGMFTVQNKKAETVVKEVYLR